VPTAFELVAQGKEVISKSDTLVLRSAALSTYEAAEELGQRWQHGRGPERPLESHNWQLRYGSWFLLAESPNFCRIQYGAGAGTLFSTMHIRILPPEPGLLTSYRSLQSDNGAFALFDN
jgi:hypothetical protein